MLQNILLMTIGFILGSLITMFIESSMTVSYLHKLRRTEFENKQLKQQNANMFDDYYKMSTKINEMKQVLKTNGIPDYDNW